MKKHVFAAFAALSIISSLSAFQDKQDKPALTRKEKVFLMGTKKMGTATGIGTGAVTGGVTGAAGGFGGTAYAHSDSDPSEGAAIGLLATGVGAAGGVAGAATGAGVGGYLGTKGGRAAGTYALAKRHGVSYRTEQISQFYNINLEQYGPLLVSAERGNPDAILQAIQSIYPKRFGKNWQQDLSELFETYKDEAKRILTQTRKRIGEKKKDFIRMIELGAAMANLFYKTRPNKAQAYYAAARLYQHLGLL